MKVLVSKSRKQKHKVEFTVSDSDTLEAVLSLLCRMNRDCTEGHSATYIGDAGDDGEFSVGIDGDGAAFVGDIKVKSDGDRLKSIDPKDYLRRGKHEFVNGVHSDGRKAFNLRPGTEVIYKGERYFLDYSSWWIQLKNQAEGHPDYNPRPIHQIKWSDYLKRSFDTRHKLFKIPE